MRDLDISAWASMGESCQVSCRFDGDDLVHLVIGPDGHGLELILNAAGLRNMVATCSKALAEMDAFEQAGGRHALIGAVDEARG